jgi:hypothetical protein
MFAIGDFVDFIGSWADARGRRVFSPCYDDDLLPIRAGADNDPVGAEGYSGYVVNGLAVLPTTTFQAPQTAISPLLASGPGDRASAVCFLGWCNGLTRCSTSPFRLVGISIR